VYLLLCFCFRIFFMLAAISWPDELIIYCTQELKYNFQALWAPSSFPPFISWAFVSIAVFQIINDRLNVLR